MKDSCLLGIDAGGSRTRIHVYVAGSLVHEESAGAANPQVVGTERCALVLRSGIEKALLETDAHPVVIGLAIAGVGSRAERQEPGRAVLDELGARFAGTQLAVWNDAEAALAGAFAGRGGIMLLSGTGSALLGYDGRNSVKRAGGWGRRLGDPGSAYSLFQAAARQVLAAHEGKAPACPALAEILLCRLSLLTPTDLIGLFARGPSAEQIQRAVDAVHEASAERDDDAERLLMAVARELRDSLLALRKRMPAESVYAVAACGGLLEREGPIRADLARWLAEGIPGVARDLSRPMKSAASAAAWMAAEKFSIEAHGYSALLSALASQ